MPSILRRIVHLPRLLLVAVVRAYQYVISPHIPSSCRYVPTCSEYSIQALRRYGAVRGSILTVHRLLRCHPWGGHGFDPPRWFGEGANDAATASRGAGERADEPSVEGATDLAT